MIATDICIAVAAGFMVPLMSGDKSGRKAAEQAFSAFFFLLIGFVCSLG